MLSLGPDTPGPGAYQPKDSPRSLAASLSGRHGKTKVDVGPGPGAYAPNTNIVSVSSPRHSLASRTTTVKDQSENPGPGSYQPNFNHLKNGPAVSLSGRTKGGSEGANHSSPGPGSYSTPSTLGTNQISKKSSPGFSMAARIKDPTSRNFSPGAGTYNPPSMFGKGQAPSHSLSSRTSSIFGGKTQELPGPGSYSPKSLESPRSSSFGVREEIYKVPKSSVNYKEVDKNLSPVKKKSKPESKAE